jgi:hypothetical protein
MSERTYSFLNPGSSTVPAEVAAATEPGPAVLVRVAEGERTAAYIVASPTLRKVEVFELATPNLGYPEGLVVATRRFCNVGGQAFQDRRRQSPEENSDPTKRIYFYETILYREPSTIVYRTEYPRGVMQDDVDAAVDISNLYMPWPAPGDWEPFVTFHS